MHLRGAPRVPKLTSYTSPPLHSSFLVLQGTESELAGKSSACDGCPNQSTCASNEPKLPDPDLPIIRERMKGVKKKILVLSGKGGVGKSTFSSGLGWALSADEEVQVSSRVSARLLLVEFGAEEGKGGGGEREKAGVEGRRSSSFLVLFSSRLSPLLSSVRC